MKIYRKNQFGFTLIELLVAMAISMFVLMAVLSIFNSSSLSYNIQEDIAAVQQDVRVGKMFIERDVRMAGAGLVQYPMVGILTAEDLQPFIVENNLGVNESDKITISYVIPVADECGSDPDDTDAVDKSCSSLSQLMVGDDMPASSAQADIDPATDVESWADGCYCGGETYSPPAFGFEFLIETPPGVTPQQPPETGVLTQVQHNGNSNMIQNRPIWIDGVRIENKIVNPFPAGSTIKFLSLKPLERVQYFVNDENVLMRKHDVFENKAWSNNAPQPIAEHIEDLQFAFGLDTDDDGTVNNNGWRWNENAGHFDGDGDLSDVDKPLVRTVRISVLGRTDKGRRELAPTLRPALEDHAAATDSDYFRRRLSQIEVELRNVAIATN